MSRDAPNILLLSEIFPPKHGGSGRWFFELYRRLTPGTVTLLTHRNNNDREHSIDEAFPQTVVRVPMASANWGVLSGEGLGFYGRMVRTILKIKPRQLDQIHCGRTLPEGVMGLAVSRLLSKTLICYVHGEDIEVARTSRELAMLVRWVLKGSKRLICNSQNTRNLLIEHWQVPEPKITVLNPGVDTTTFTPAEQDARFRLKMGWEDAFVALTVGRLQRRKGHDAMIEALPAIRETIPNIKYAIVGDGDQRPRLQALVKEHKLEQVVQFLDELDDAQLVQCYQQCDFFILPNRADGNDIEGFGMVLVEAQAAGKPVIAGDSGGTAETMVQGDTGLIVDCTRPSAIQVGVVQLFEAMQNGQFTPEACRNHVLDNLTWERHTAKAVNLFDEVSR